MYAYRWPIESTTNTHTTRHMNIAHRLTTMALSITDKPKQNTHTTKINTSNRISTRYASCLVDWWRYCRAAAAVDCCRSAAVRFCSSSPMRRCARRGLFAERVTKNNYLKCRLCCRNADNALLMLFQRHNMLRQILNSRNVQPTRHNAKRKKHYIISTKLFRSRTSPSPFAAADDAVRGHGRR